MNIRIRKKSIKKKKKKKSDDIFINFLRLKSTRNYTVLPCKIPT